MGGIWRGPMHGIPYAAKDIFDVAGMATTCHSKLRMDHRATTDATVIARLRAAGAILLGKLALHEFATGGPTRDLPWPAALNPWNLDLHPGGSSSGSAVAVATGLARESQLSLICPRRTWRNRKVRDNKQNSHRQVGPHKRLPNDGNIRREPVVSGNTAVSHLQQNPVNHLPAVGERVARDRDEDQRD